MNRLVRLFLICLAAALLVPAASSAAPRMYVGFQDDQNFRWTDDRTALLDQASNAGTTIIRITVEWAQAAPTRPANPGNPFDPAYRLDDVDELVRNAQARGFWVLLSIFGTPPWANGGKDLNRVPKQMKQLQLFAKALASRYSGRFTGYPAVGFFSVWNEPNLNRFLAPQFDKKGRSVAPKLYAKLVRAVYAGVKAGNKKALVAAGETSPRGRDKPSPGPVSDSHSPGRFAQLVSQARPRIKFDAWAHHPYSTNVRARPTQKVRWPNVNLTRLKQLGRSIDKWFKRKNTPIWITEYGYQTRPERPDGVTYKKQRDFAQQALNLAKRDPRVEMFIWFILRDSPVANSAWQGAGGLITSAGGIKPAFNRFANFARAVDVRNAEFRFKRGTRNPLLRVAVLELKAANVTGTQIGVSYTLKNKRRFLGNAATSAAITKDGYVTFRPELVVGKGDRYLLDVTMNDKFGNTVNRKLTIRPM